MIDLLRLQTFLHAAESLSFSEAARQMHLTQPTVSHHLRKLEEAGLVEVRQEGRQRFYTLNQRQLSVCCGVLVSAFAPDYADNVVRVDDITLAD